MTSSQAAPSRPSTDDLLVAELVGLAQKGGGLTTPALYRRSTLESVADLSPAATTRLEAALQGVGPTPVDVDLYLGVAARARRARRRYLSIEQLRQLEPPGTLVTDVLGLGEVAVLFGAPGTYKTFAALDLAFAVATGETWHGRPTSQGAVVYMAGEGLSTLHVRVDALIEHRRPQVDPSMIFTGDVPDLTKEDAFDSDLPRLLSTQPALIVIDTLALAMPGADENLSKDMGRAMENLRFLAKVSGAAVLVLHHNLKRGGDSPRGSGALEGAADVVILAKAHRGGVRLSSHKQRDRVAFEPIQLAVRPLLNSVVLESSDGWATVDDPWGPQDRSASLAQRARVIIEAQDQPISQSRLQELLGVAGTAMKPLREWIGDNAGCGIHFERVGNAFRYSSSTDPSGPSAPPP